MAKTLRTDAHAALLDLLRRAREEAGLTQAAVAERLGKPQSYVAKTESGERRLDMVEFVALAQALEANPAIMVEEVGRTLLAETEAARQSSQG